jgi:diaminohydroxyphosphoribosylaminopyrimidine deaminase/5-amino-6-(5-phosphoribosylamino)uracil reductase
MSLDGKIATVTGESKWITGEQARLDVHRYRHEHDAILVGVNTVLADNPSLTTRLPNGGKHPIRIILDTNLRTPLDSLVVTDGMAPTWIIVGSHVPQEKWEQYTSDMVTVIRASKSRIEINEVLAILGEKGILSLFVEGGQQVNASFLEAKCFQQFIVYISPKLIGGQAAPTIFGGSGFSSLADAASLSIQSIETIGDDIKIVAIPK